MTAPARLLAVATLALLVACSAPAPSRDPQLPSHGDEAPVAATVPGGAETLPVWQRQPDGSGSGTSSGGGKAILVVPADLLFATDSAALSPAASAVLHLVVAEFSPGGHVLVEGHADSDGSRSYNQALSERRATAVADWLAANGIARSAIETQGWGEDRPAVPDTDEAAKAKNRRVVVTVTPPPPPAAAATAPTAVRRAAALPIPNRTPGRLRTAARRSDDPPTTTTQRRSS